MWRSKLEMKAISLQVLSCAGLLALANCGNTPGYRVLPQEQETSQDIVVDNKIDILFVVDNSKSMDPEQEVLKQSFENFIKEFQAKGFDFHIGVISTDTMGDGNYWTGQEFSGQKMSKVTETVKDEAGAAVMVPKLNARGKPVKDKDGKPVLVEKTVTKSVMVDDGEPLHPSTYRNFANNGPGSLLVRKNPEGDFDASLKFLTNSTPDLIERFQETATIGSDSYFAESPLLALQEFFSPRMIIAGGWNEGFRRKEAQLAIIIVSDEDESDASFVPGRWGKSAYLADMAQDLQNARAKAFVETMDQVVGKQRSRLHFAAVVTPVGTKIENEKDPNLQRNVEARFLTRITKELNGTILDVRGDFSVRLANLAKTFVTDILTKFELPQPFVPNTLRVCVDETPEDQRDCLGASPTARILSDVSKGGSDGYVLLPNPADASRPIIEFRGNAIPQRSGIKVRFYYTPAKPKE